MTESTGFSQLMSAVEVAALLLDGNWHIDRRTITEGSRSHAGWVKLFERTGERISLQCNTYGNEGRIRVSAGHGLQVRFETAITVGLDLGGEHLARHINDRFLPEYRAAFAESKKYKQGQDSNEDESTRNLALLASILDLKKATHLDIYTFKGGNVRQNYKGQFTFELDLSIDEACRVAVLLRDLSRTLNND